MKKQQVIQARPSILVIDADTNAARITAAIIKQAAPTAFLTLATTAEEGARLFDLARPDVLVIDPAPRSQSAAHLISRATQQQPRLPVIVIASLPTPALRRQMHDLKVDLYLEKPLLLPLCINDLLAVLPFSDTNQPRRAAGAS